MEEYTEELIDLGFIPISTEKYLEAMKDHKSIAYVSAKVFSRYQWYLYEGNLDLTPEQVKLLVGESVIITGSLQVHGLLDFTNPANLFVFGDVTANNVFLDGAGCYFAKNIYGEFK
jgi:hypothetical protein